MSADVTLIDGSTFAISGAGGDITDSSAVRGMFVQDVRVLSRWRLTIDGKAPERLSTIAGEPFEANFIAKAAPKPGAEPTLVLERYRTVSAGLREDLKVRNYSPQPAEFSLEMEADADFRGRFDLSGRRMGGEGDRPPIVTANGDELRISRVVNGTAHEVQIVAEGANAVAGKLLFQVSIPAGGTWTASVHVTASTPGSGMEPGALADRHAALKPPGTGLAAWRNAYPGYTTSWAPLQRALSCSERDLGALRITVPGRPEMEAVAAGVPWFMTLFGRDSLLTSLMMLPFNQSLPLGTLRALAGFQGRKSDPVTEEEPGRILHEMRSAGSGFPLGDGRIYYGTVDATPLFVMLLGELERWGADKDEVDELLPCADAALEWIEHYGDLDGDGLVEYEVRLEPGRLAHLAWKDGSADAIHFADGTPAEGPLALAEVQGYVYAAYLARAELARTRGDSETATRCAEKAKSLKERFNERFWLADRGYYAVALDGRKQPVDSLASNMGHCLWTGIIDTDNAQAVADHLLSSDMFTGFGVRTMAKSTRSYNPASYQHGGVWPHDNALIAAGLMRYGFVSHAQRIAEGLIDAAEFFSGRLPELFCGFDRSEFATPVEFPAGCSPQAWAAAAPLLIVRTLLRLEPNMRDQTLTISPVFPDACPDLELTNMPLGRSRLTVSARRGKPVAVNGLPPHIELITEPATPTEPYAMASPAAR
jgi:glycogen debranching enzyme